MEQPDTLVLDPAADAEASSSASSEESASAAVQDTGTDISPAARDQMNALIRGELAGLEARSASKPDDTDDEVDAEATGGESASASAEGVKPPASGQEPGRRGAAAEIQRLNGEVERLSKALESLQPAPPPDPSDEARTRAIETETRYRRLLVKPETDADWTNEDIQFLESEKKRRAVAPELQQHYETVLESDRQALRTWADQTIETRWNAVKADLSATLALPGVTDEVKAQLLRAPLSEQVLIHRRLERESLEPEIKRLREENADLKRDLYGAARAPLNGGRSSPGRTYSANDLMNTLIRGGRV